MSSNVHVALLIIKFVHVVGAYIFDYFSGQSVIRRRVRFSGHSTRIIIENVIIVIVICIILSTTIRLRFIVIRGRSRYNDHSEHDEW